MRSRHALGGSGDGQAATPLPASRSRGPLSLEEALARRRSVRELAGEPLADAELAQLLWAAQGVTAAWGGRTAPSAGALYPLEVYAATSRGLFRYRPSHHDLEQLAPADLRRSLARAALGQEAVAGAAAVVVVAGVEARLRPKYGPRAGRYLLLEAGHAAQNVLLQAVALDLAAVPIGAFDDDEVRRVLRLPEGEEPLELLPVGPRRS